MRNDDAVRSGGAEGGTPAPPPYALIVESMTEGVSLASQDGIIVYTNAAEDRMFGYGPGELVGQHVSVQNAYPAHENEKRVADVIATLQAQGVWEGEWHNRRKDGTTFYTASRITAVTIEGRTHWLCVQRDVTDVRAAEAAHRESEERLELAIEGTGVGIYDLDLASGEGVWSASAFRMLGYDPAPGGRATFDMWRARVHPDDLDYVLGEHARAAGGGDLRMEFRILRADTGETRWLAAFGRILPAPGGGRSIGTVLDTTERRLTEEARRESAERLDIAVNAHRIGIFEWHVQTGEVLWSAQEAALFGVAPGEFGGRIEDWAESLPPEEAERMNALMAEAMAERRDRLDFAFRIRRRDTGEMRWLEGSARFLYADDGTPLRMVGTNKDVTERRQAEEHQRLLVNELNHRVKNTLAIIQGIAQQTFRGSDVPAQQREAFEGRLAALSAAHNLLTRANWEAASVREVLETATAPYRGGEGRLTLEGPDVRVEPRTAVSLALAVHELGTNAAKYGALSRSEGAVSVRWDAKDGDLGLVWRESGGPPVTPPASRGFGTRMIERALAAELGGEARIEFAPEGLVCTVGARLA
jgi:PAS domain S-box-containing protein